MKRSTEWLSKQLLTIGSTAAGIVAGTSPYEMQMRELYDAMVAAADGRFSAKLINDDMRRGLLTEPLHRVLLQEALGTMVEDHDQENFLYNQNYPWAHALPDGWIFKTTQVPNLQGTLHETIPVQLKCPRIKGWYDIKLKGIHGYWLVGSQHSLAITGHPYEHFSVLNVESMRLIHFPVYRDQEFIDRLMQIEKFFYEQFERRERPEVVPTTPVDLPQLEGNLLTINTKEANDIVFAYKAARELRQEAQALMEDAEARITELMGDARVVQLPALRCYRIQNDGRTTYDHDAMKRDGVDLPRYARHGKAFSFLRAFATTEAESAGQFADAVNY